MTSKRVLHVVQGLDDRLGGLQAAVIAMANAQARAGHQVMIAAGAGEDDTQENLAQLDASVTVRVFAFGRMTRRFWGSPGLRRWLAAAVEHADAVHVHAIWALPPHQAARRALASGTTLFISPHGSLEPYDVAKHSRIKQVLGPLFIKRILQGAHRVVCTTDREAEGLTTYGAATTCEVIPLPGGAVSAPSSTREEFRAAHGIPADAKVLLFLGRLDHKKGLHLLIEVLDRLPHDLGAHLVIVGGGDQAYETSIKAQIRHLGVGDKVTWTGWLGAGEKSAAFHSSDLFVLLSYNENYGITVVEATQHGLPVVLTSDVYASSELLRYGAAVETTRDPDAASDTIVTLLSDQDRLAQMSLAAGRFVNGYLQGDRIDAAYQQLLC